MTIKLIAGAVASLVLLLASPAAAATLANASATTSTFAANAQGTATVSFTTVSALPGGANYNVPYMNFLDLSLQGVVTTNCTDFVLTVNGITQVPIYCYSDQSQSFIQISGPVAAGSSVVFRTPVQFAATAPSGNLDIRTSDTPPNTAIDVATVTVNAPVATPVPTLSEWAMILLGATLAGLALLYIQQRPLTA